MAIYDLQGLGTDTANIQEISSVASSVGCCVPSNVTSAWSITCYDSWF